MALEQEMETFKRSLPGLLSNPDSLEKYALVRADEVVGLYSTFEAALEVGYDRFGPEPFLVRQVTTRQQPKYFSRNLKQ